MILTMAYLLLIAGLLGLSALAGERICAMLGYPRRGVWLIALCMSLGLPALALTFNAADSTTTPFMSLPLLFDQFPIINTDTVTATSDSAAAPIFTWPEWQVFEKPLAVLWAISSGALLLLYLLAGTRMRCAVRSGQSVRIDDEDVLLSEDFGPAVLGFFRPRIVLPHWLARQATPLRAQVLLHEREHIAARDQLTLLAALLIVASMPWNLPLWWQLRRLRTAIEIDCDSRVLSGGADAREYSRALLTVGRQALRTPFPAVALIEPMSELERRIRTMLHRAREISAGDMAVESVTLVLLLSVAFAVNAPNAQVPTESDAADPVQAPSPGPLPPLRLAFQDRFSAAQACLTHPEPDLTCARDLLDEISELRDFNAHEQAQLLNFMAFISVEANDLNGAIAAYEELIKLPHNQLPNGLVSAAFRGLATLYAQTERYVDALSMYDRWEELPFITLAGQDYFFRAQLLAMLAQYNEAIAETQRAITSTTQPQEPWFRQLYQLQKTMGDDAGAEETLEILTRKWPQQDPERPSLAAAELAPGADYLPVVKPAPIYPPRAAQRGIEGYVIVEYTVTTTGETKDWLVIESTLPLFDRAAIESVKKYKYRPRLIDGTPIEVAGVRTKIEFVLED